MSFSSYRYQKKFSTKKLKEYYPHQSQILKIVVTSVYTSAPTLPSTLLDHRLMVSKYRTISRYHVMKCHDISISLLSYDMNPNANQLHLHQETQLCCEPLKMCHYSVPIELHRLLILWLDDIITASHHTSQHFDCRNVICSSRWLWPAASWSAFDQTS